jgi:uncharacterized membrane protein
MKLILYLLTLLIHTATIWLWYTLVAQNVYGQQSVNLLVGNLNPIVAGGLYLLYVTGLFYFTVELPLRQHWGSVSRAAFNGAFFGLMGPAGNFWTNLTSRHLPLWFLGVEIVCLPAFVGTTAAVIVWIGKKWEKKLKSQNQALSV